MTERIELEILPAIAGHAHTTDAAGRVSCGCVPRVHAFNLRSPRCERITFPAHSNCDVGSDIPGGGAA